MYEPIEVVETRVMRSDFDEDVVTKEYMRVHGIDNVRGGSYSAPKLDFVALAALRRELYASKDSCFRCGRDSHWASDCYARTSVDGRKLC